MNYMPTKESHPIAVKTGELCLYCYSSGGEPAPPTNCTYGYIELPNAQLFVYWCLYALLSNHSSPNYSSQTIQPSIGAHTSQLKPPPH